MEGGLVSLRGGGAEARGASVGGRAPQAVAGGESGLGDPGDALPGDAAWLEGTEAEDGARRGGVLRGESGTDEVRRIFEGGLSDRQWSGRGSVSASGEGPDGADGDALAAVGRAGDAGPPSHLPERRLGPLLGLPCGAGGSTALREDTGSRVRSIPVVTPLQIRS